MEKNLLQYNVVRDITYCNTTSENSAHEHKFKTDLYIPVQNEDFRDRSYDYQSSLELDYRQKTNMRDDGQKKTPVVIFVHGGGWRRGDKDAWKHFICEDINLMAAFIFFFYSLYGNVGAAMARRGIPCAVMSYPLTRLKSSWILLEMLTSYMASVLFISVIFGLVLLIGTCLATLFSVDLLHQILYNSHTLPVPLQLGTGLLAVLLVTSNLCILALISGQYQRYGLKQYQVILIWICVLLNYILGQYLNFDSSSLRIILFLLTLIISQGVLITTNLSTKPVTASEQVTALVQCIKEVKQYGYTTNCFDQQSVFLMGHSAGGHLCSITTLCGKQLFESGVTATDIKGVIAISAVLDVGNLNKRPISQLYLHPTFGTDRDLWHSLSPVHNIKLAPHHIPHFLVVTAENDFHLNKDASDFCEELARKKGQLRSVMIPRTNHISIMFYFDSYINKLNLANICCKFIHDTMSSFS